MGTVQLGSDYTLYYHNTLSLDHTAATGSGFTRGIFQSASAVGIEYKNNVVSITRGGGSAKHGIYFSTPSSTIASDYNNIYVNSAGSGNQSFGYLSGDVATLADWQLVNGGTYDANTTDGDPLLVDPANGDVAPSSASANENGVNLSIADDFLDVARDATPDRGAIEFTPANSNLKIAGVTGGLDTLNCFSATQSFGFAVTNLVGAADFSTNGLTIQWSVSGPAAASGSIAVNAGMLNDGDTTIYTIVSPVDMSAPGVYNIDAYLSYSPDVFTNNDTLASTAVGAPNIVVEASDMALYFGQQVEVSASHPMLQQPLSFTEIWQSTAEYSSTVAFPAFLAGSATNRDYVEFTNFGNGTVNLEGWQFERVGTADHVYTFPAGASLTGGASCVLISGFGTDDPANNVFYIESFTDPVFAWSTVGYILRDPNGLVVDAVATNGYSFNNDVASADWSGTMGSLSGQMGAYLNGADDNTATNWAVTASGYQNTPSMGIANGSSTIGDPVVDWTENGALITDTLLSFVTTPPAAGSYTYAASFTDNTGCVYHDSVVVTMSSFTCTPPTNLQLLAASDSSLTIGWDTVAGATSYKIVLRDRTSNQNVIVFKHQQEGLLTINGLPSGNRYFVQIRAQCGAGFNSLSDRLIVETFPTSCDDVTTYSAGPIGAVQARLNFVSTATGIKTWIRWKPLGAMNWTDTIVKDTSRTLHWLTGLTPGTTYRWEVKAPCTVSGLGSNWSPTQSFTTPTNKWDLFGSTSDQGYNSVLVFPNPSNGAFRIEFLHAAAGDRQLQLINALGQVVHTQRATLADGNNSVALDLDLPTGIYFLEISSEADRSVERLVIE